MQDTNELRANIIKEINKNTGRWREELDKIIEDYEAHVRLVDETSWYDDHGDYEFVQVYSVALNDETRDVKFFNVYVAVEGNTMYAEPVKPMTKVVTTYVKE